MNEMATDHDRYGRSIGGTRWFNTEPDVHVAAWLCPIDGHPMVRTGYTWPTVDPGIHHRCSGDDCGFTAALRQSTILRLGIAR